VPAVYKFIIKYVTPAFLLIILGTWFWQEWLPIMAMRGVPEEKRPYILGTRVFLLALFGALAALVKIAWRKKRKVRR